MNSTLPQVLQTLKTGIEGLNCYPPLTQNEREIVLVLEPCPYQWRVYSQPPALNTSVLRLCPRHLALQAALSVLIQGGFPDQKPQVKPIGKNSYWSRPLSLLPASHQKSQSQRHAMVIVRWTAVLHIVQKCSSRGKFWTLHWQWGTQFYFKQSTKQLKCRHRTIPNPYAASHIYCGMPENI